MSCTVIWIYPALLCIKIGRSILLTLSDHERLRALVSHGSGKPSDYSTSFNWTAQPGRSLLTERPPKKQYEILPVYPEAKYIIKCQLAIEVGVSTLLKH